MEEMTYSARANLHPALGGPYHWYKRPDGRLSLFHEAVLAAYQEAQQ